MARLNGVDVAMANGPRGVSLRFEGPPDTVARLRANVHAMADANVTSGDPFSVCACAASYRKEGAAEAMPGSQPDTKGESETSAGEPPWNEGSLGTSGPPGPPPSSNDSTPGQAAPDAPVYDPSVRARVDEIPAGAKLTLTTGDLNRVQALRDRVRMDARAMQAGCMGTPSPR
jgi:hypothetical protein